MSNITTHVLDTAAGKPAAGIAVHLALRMGDTWKELATARTDADGRVATLVAAGSPSGRGIFRLRFDIAEYFTKQGIPAFYPYVEIVFEVRDETHHHVPLLLSPYGYSTYRGS